MTSLLSFWSHGLACVLYASLTFWQLRHRGEGQRNRHLAIAFAVTAAWSGAAAILGPQQLVPMLLSSARTFAFLSFMYAVLRSAQQGDRQRPVTVVYFTVAAVIGFDVTIKGLLPQFAHVAEIHGALLSTAHFLGLTVAAGCLVLVHNVYSQASTDSRWAIRLPMIGLAGMWFYDLHLNTVGYLSGDPVDDLYAVRGLIMAMLVPAFALGSRRGMSWKLKLSRAATFQSVSALGILAYLLLMMSATRVLEFIGGQWVRIGQVGLIFATTLAVLILLSSTTSRAWLRVWLSKHLFQHRYDYREEWLRFTNTMGVGGDNAAPIEERVVKALADIAESPAALLLVPDGQYRLTPAASWNWPDLASRDRSGEADFARFLEGSGHIVEFELTGEGLLRVGGRDIKVPRWMRDDGFAWAGVPLIHNERLVGLVLLAHPLLRRPLDWEDFDLFRTAGRQAASYLAEARSHHALADAQRFDEFNRRFAFIMHDIKNLVSQLSLVARNAERHAENPEFRADMIATLQSSVRKMNELLARLSRGNAAEAQPPRPMPLAAVITGIVEAKRRAHPIELSADPSLVALADQPRLEQALSHLIQNAGDASPAGVPVRVSVGRREGEIAIEVRDQGPGMSAEFIRTRLFQPFASTKDGGFGIGAYEARMLVTAMGGRLEVESREGQGSRFTIFLPPGELVSGLPERMRA